MIYFFFRRFVE